MQRLMHINADIEGIWWNINAKGLGDAYFEQILCNIDAEESCDKYFKWILWNINTGFGFFCYWENIVDKNTDVDWCIFQANIMEYQSRGIEWCYYRENIVEYQ